MIRKTLVFIFLLFLIAATSEAKVPVRIINEGQTSIAPMLDRIMPAVVNIVTLGELPIPNDPFLQREMMKRLPQDKPLPDNHFASVGSGVIIDAEKGYIITNAHVVDLARTIIITLSDGRRLPARKIGADNDSDIALLQIQAKNLVAMPFADSKQLKVGDFVAALGSPFGLNQTVTSGIVSALHRSHLGIEGLENFIQTDAPINAGNSGGPLVNTHGEIVGINTALVSNTGSNIGIGFAIPANMAQSIIKQLLKFGEVHRGLMGIFVQTLSPDLAVALSLPENQKGAIVSQILPFTPAEQIQLRVGDIITLINGEPIESNEDVLNAVGLLRIGEPIKLDVLRDGKMLHFESVIQNPKDTEEQQRINNPYLFGLELKVVSEYRPPFGEIQGLQIVRMDPYSPALIAGLQVGDIIVSANKHPVRTIKDILEQAKSSNHGLLLNVIHQKGSNFFLVR